MKPQLVERFEKVNFKIDTNRLKADVTWDPDGVEFKVNLILGQ